MPRRTDSLRLARARSVAAAVLCLIPLTGTSCHTLNYPAEKAPVYIGLPGVRPQAHPRLRIVSYNIAFAVRVDLAIEALTQPPLQGADILALQEMDAPAVEAIAHRLGYGYVYFPVSLQPRSKRDFGNAILSPWPIRNARKLMLPHKSLIMNQRRAATIADVEVAGRSYRVYSTHLGAPVGTSNGRRRDQCDVILADARDAQLPVIILGDLNNMGIARRISTQGYTWVTKNIAPTTHRFRFDHILIRGLPEAEGASAATWASGPKASDHHPIWAEIDLNEPLATPK